MKTSRFPILDWIPIASSVVGFLTTLVVDFPGWMSPDSLDQYSQALTGNYGDWHPPLMAWWWNKLLFISTGPSTLLIENLLFYWAAWALFSIGLTRIAGWWGTLLPIFGFWPGLLMILGNIWKDVVFSTALTLVIAILFYFQTRTHRPNWPTRVLLVILIILAIGSKPNGVVAMPFILYYWLAIEFRLRIGTSLKIVSALVGTALSYVLSLVPLLGTRVELQDSSQYLKAYDLVGISIRSGKDYLPAYLRGQFENSNVNWREVYNIDNGNALFWPPGGGGARTALPENLSELSRAWLDAVLHEPRAYLDHRAEHFGAMLGVSNTLEIFVSTRGIDPNSYGLTYESNRLSRILFKLSDQYPAIFFSSWAYLALLTVAAVGLALMAKPVRLFAITSAAAAASFAAIHFFIGPAPDFRYFFFTDTVATTLVGMAVLVAFSRIIQPHRQKEASLPQSP